ncbi:mycothione reductase [Solicola sp. PLA-1-18]|uniref:mycothione reductase n=1 Tax=Solicola sp. PLA-1-18 TaxID=3380532 RepID=UPI003B7959A8
MTHYDLVIVGAGSGNSILDERFDHLKVAMVERGPFGGTCVNRGCIPSKMYAYPAEVAESAAHGHELDLDTSMDGADWRAMRDRIIGRVDGIAKGGKEYREGLENVDVLTGTARFTGPRELAVELESGETVALTADQVVLAAGGRPVVPDVPGLHDVVHHTSDTIMRIDALPARIGVLGGGYVGSELANVFASLGSQVVQIDSAPRLLNSHDEQVSQLFTDTVSARWDVRLDASLDEVTGDADGPATLHLSDGTTAEVDMVLVAAGRSTNADLLDVEKGGIDLDDAGRVVVDVHQRTSAEGVFALGDLSSPEPLKHVANQDARIVQHNLLNPDDLQVSDHRFVPNAVFAHPQVAAVGLTEQQAREAGLDVAVGVQEYGDTAHGWAMRLDDSGCFVKLVGDRATGLLVGAHLVGPQASVLIQPLIQAMSFDQPVAGLARGQYWIHPALTETVESALLALEADLGV